MIEIVRKAKDQKAARSALQKALQASEEQTDAILRLQLGQLTRLNSGKLNDEKKELEASRKKVRSRVTCLGHFRLISWADFASFLAILFSRLC